jgi:hypothetical protein
MRSFKPDKVPDLKYKEAIKRPIRIKCVQINEPFAVETMEGLMKGKKGDWLIIGVNGEMYPIDNEIFQKTYDICL